MTTICILITCSDDYLYFKGCTGSKITSSPQQLYVQDGDQGIVRCQNRSDDGEHFYSYIYDAIWYRKYENGSNVTISMGTGTVHSRGYTLKFNPLLAEDQGHYFCCAQSGQCSEALTTAIISSKPILNLLAIQFMYVKLKCLTKRCTAKNYADYFVIYSATSH